MGWRGLAGARFTGRAGRDLRAAVVRQRVDRVRDQRVEHVATVSFECPPRSRFLVDRRRFPAAVPPTARVL
jgi:hypothetical protein